MVVYVHKKVKPEVLMILLTVTPAIVEIRLAVGGERGNVLERRGHKSGKLRELSPINFVSMPTQLTS